MEIYAAEELANSAGRALSRLDLDSLDPTKLKLRVSFDWVPPFPSAARIAIPP